MNDAVSQAKFRELSEARIQSELEKHDIPEMLLPLFWQVCNRIYQQGYDHGLDRAVEIMKEEA